jgi:hypothetical protein
MRSKKITQALKTKRSSSNEEEDSQWPHTVDFDLDGASGKSRPIIVEDEEDVQPTNLAAEMLRIHHQCGQISFARHDTQNKGRMAGSNLFGMPICKSNKVKMVEQDCEQPQRSNMSFEAR